jgi:uroporphyrinogen decarboxylase
MKPKDRILSVLNLEKPDRIPTFEWFVDKNVGKILTGSEDPIEIVEKLDLDGINIRPDYQREAIDESTFRDEWGTIRKETGDSIAAITKSPIENIANHKDYSFPDLNAPSRFNTIEKAIKHFGDHRAIILNLRDGFSDMRDLLGYEKALIGTMAQTKLFVELLDRVVDYNLSLATRAVETYDIKIVATTDDIATNSGLLIRPQVYFDVIGPAFKRVMQGYKKLGLKIIKHCDGDCSALIDFWIDAGIDCLDPIDPGANFKMADFKQRYGDQICLKGNIDCKGALESGTPDEVKAEVKQCLIDGAQNLILSSSNTIHQGIKPENYTAMLEALREFGDKN